ncbi:MAG: hypothetical protein U9N61_03030 [Euryarchaeota archaeon]|nr:hypothetical protein [Euryarchaeota archaeon]
MERVNSALTDWEETDKLREYPNGTEFLLKTHRGAIHFCRLCGNLPDDINWKFLRLTDGKYMKLDKRSKFILYPT